ncbi:unnamed protein product, partial [Ectocarpus sp. 12 AP-2014]
GLRAGGEQDTGQHLGAGRASCSCFASLRTRSVEAAGRMMFKVWLSPLLLLVQGGMGAEAPRNEGPHDDSSTYQVVRMHTKRSTAPPRKT